MKVCLGLHDFSVLNNRLGLLLKLKERYPGFKASLFTVPCDRREDWGAYQIRGEFLKRVRECSAWVQFIPHGLRHEGSEVRSCTYGHFKDSLIPLVERAFDMDALPFIKGFCAPHWKWNGEVVRALDDMGWWGAVHRDKDMPYTKRFYKYSHSIDEAFPIDVEVLRLHGHVYGTKNDLERCFGNLLRLPLSTEWRYCTDFLEERA